jgi:CubicO group peptidase (beta-lactamase class C family)
MRSSRVADGGGLAASPLEQPTLDMVPLRTAVASHAMSALLFEPDSKYLYSNAGINTAGRLIEVVSGMAYEDFLARRLFEPLGMKDTTFVLTEAQAARLAKSYKGNAEKTGLEETPITQLSYPLSDRRRQPMPGGGLFSTATDLGNFCRMLLAGGVFEGRRYLSAAALERMTSVHTGSLPNRYGLGWQIDKPPGTGYAHRGAHATNMRIDREHGLAFIYLVQHSGYPDREVGKQILPAFQKAAVKAWAAASR